MRAAWIVFAKEFLENLRDRRTLFSALLIGPLFGPLFFGFMVSRMLDQSLLENDQSLQVTVCGAQRAPGLADFLKAQGVELKTAGWTEAEAVAAVRAGSVQVVLLVPPEYPTLFKSGVPAPVLLVSDSADSEARKHADRARTMIATYGSGIAQLRLQLRGIDPLIATPVAVNDVDVATPTGRAVLILGFMTYFILFSVLMGGLYLAIDSTAGERERGSLEALLSLPVSRGALIGGKILATCAYMCLSLGITLTAFVVAFRFVPLERLGMSANLGPGTALAFFAICLPFVPLGACLMSLVASFAKSYREAQTYLTTVLLVPTLPIAFASIYSLKTKTYLMPVPSLSQHLLMTSVLKGEPLAAADVCLSVISSLSLALVLGALTARHWRKESMLR